MIGFDATDDEKMLVASVAQFAARTLRPRMREFERARGVPEDVRQAARAMGIPMAGFPEEVGGGGLGVVAQMLIEEELAYGDPGAAFAMGGPGAYGWAALLFGGVRAAKDLLAPFLDEGAHSAFGAVAWGEKKPGEHLGLTTRAERMSAGWKLSGEKAYVLHADLAQSFIVFAQAEQKGWEGLEAFVVPRDTPGLTVLPRQATLGLDAASFGGIALEAVEVPEAARLGYGVSVPRAVAFFAIYGLAVAARCVGLARAAFDVTREYVEERRAFGKPIGHFQAVAFTLADRAMDLEAARAMVWRAAWLWDEAKRGAEGADERAALLHTAWAVSFAKEAAMRAADDAVQLHGGAGFMRDYPVEKWMRDAKQMQLCAMTAEQADQLAAGLAVGASIDPALVLPSADSQNVFV
jgi:alkylation response protein AidB-like acyl-CoA dehydrogenase